MSCTFPWLHVKTPGTTIVSPYFPRNYLNNMDCEVSIIFESTQRVGLNFDTFETETNRECADWLMIFDGNSSNSPLLGSKYCGASNFGSIESSGKYMHLSFHSDEIITKSGFKLNTYAIGIM